jgi:glutaredoxin-like protein
MMPTKLLDEQITDQVKEVFAQLKQPVKVLFFEKKDDCETCEDARQLLTEVVELSDLLSLDIYDLDEDAEAAQRFNMDKAPGIVLAAVDGDQITDYGVRFLGIPSGHEFSTLIHDFLLISGRESGLSQKTREFLKGLTQPVHLQVFVTPTCPYCPRAVVLAHQMAMESPLVTAEGVEAMEFSALADRFNVSGVPQTTINDGAGNVLGAVPEENLVAEIMRAVSK